MELLEYYFLNFLGVIYTLENKHMRIVEKWPHNPYEFDAFCMHRMFVRRPASQGRKTLDKEKSMLLQASRPDRRRGLLVPGFSNGFHLR